MLKVCVIIGDVGLASSIPRIASRSLYLPKRQLVFQPNMQKKYFFDHRGIIYKVDEWAQDTHHDFFIVKLNSLIIHNVEEWINYKSEIIGYLWFVEGELLSEFHASRGKAP
jgi:hypothetical protein